MTSIVVYEYNPVTKEYVGNSVAFKDPMGDGYLTPPNSLQSPPPEFGKGEVVVVADGEWVVKVDNRGVKYYDADGVEYVIRDIGEELPEGALLTPPEVILTVEDILKLREQAYSKESDKLFMEAYRKRLTGDESGAAEAEQEGLRVVEDIKARYPMP